jgi:1-deoxy-D-xylulose-5-phosphate synthase
MDITNYTIEELEALGTKIRDRILEVVSKNGGHLSSTLGSVELIVAMHHLFDCKEHPFIYDVSHQAYAHKLLTDRWEEFDTLREFGGISGFIKPSESEYDYFIAGHSSTSISLGVGCAKAFRLKGEKRIPIAFIGDGSMSAGMVYEALNELGDRKYPMIIVLNDNEMSIAKPIGAISKYLSKILAGKFYQGIKDRTSKMMESLPNGASYLAKRFDESLRLITPGIIFEEMGIEYIGPIDGHNIEEIIDTLKVARDMNKPVLIHAQTLKGKGYDIAEGKLEQWHGVSPFEIESGKSIKKSSQKNATTIFSEKLLDMASIHQDIVGVTAAMPSGTGMKLLMENFDDRFFDVAIAEQHAVTSVASMAKEGLKPFVAIYSTFLQRAYDQIIHDVAIMNLPVKFAIDRAGIVGEDGETHQGVFDVSFLRVVPNMVIFAPRCQKSLEDAIEFAYNYNDSPCAFRFPRGSFEIEDDYDVVPFELGRGEVLQSGDSGVLFLGFGNGVAKAVEVAKLLDIKVTIVDLRFVKPLDENLLKELSKNHSKWFVFSETSKSGGVASALMEFLSDNDILNVSVKSFEYGDNFITHGKKSLVEESLGLLSEQIAQNLRKLI